MQETDIDRILNFLNGNEPSHEFESWVYNNTNLENSIGGELYFELIEINYKDKFVLDNLKRIVLGNYVSQDHFENFKYKNILLNAGWHPNRKIEVNLSKVPNTPEIQNASEIIEKFGGLKFISPDKRENWSLTLVEFLKVPYVGCDMSKYGFNKKLACFATAHNDHIDLFVDADNKFYQLDNVVSENLYEFKGQNFYQMMRQLLELNDEDNFEIIGRNKTIANNGSNVMAGELVIETGNKKTSLWSRLKSWWS